MNIDGKFYQNASVRKNLRVSNPINIKKQNNTPSFSGHVLTTDSRGNDVYKFNLPNAKPGSKLEVVILAPQADGKFKIVQAPMKFDVPEGFKSVTIPASQFNLEKNETLGYKFTIPGVGEFTDNCVKVDETPYNIAMPVNRANPERPRQMEHVFIDSFNVKNVGKSIKRNHFNQLGGTLNDVKEKVPQLCAMGARNILGVPIFGDDPNSSHGYWTCNPYHVTRNLGTLSDFNELHRELYRYNMSWTADGAFVNEGLSGMHLADLMIWGKDSPFLPMFDTKDIGDQPFRFGVLSKQENVDKHTHFQLKNAPVKIIFEKAQDGTYREKEIVRNGEYDPKRDSYVQLFDDRLASEEQMNSNEKFSVYANKDSGDNFEIANYKDSVQAYSPKVSVKSIKENLEKYYHEKKSNPDVELKDFLKRWPNFSFEESNKAGGISLWVGNSDIAKKRFVAFENVLDGENITPEQRILINAAQYQVQDDTVQVGKFWTSEVARNLTGYTAKQLADALKDTKNNYEEAIKKLINERKLAPQAAKVTYKDESGTSPLDNILKTNFFGARGYNLKMKKLPENITDGLMNYPLEAIEYANDVSGVFAYPYIKNAAVEDHFVGKSRYEMFKMGNDYYNEMPKKFRAAYKKMDSLYANEMTAQAENILDKLAKKIGRKLFEQNGDLTLEGREIYSLVAPDIAKFLVVSSLTPDIKFKDNNADFEYDVDELSKIDLNALNLQYEVSPESVAFEMINKIKNGLEDISEEEISRFVEHLANRLDGVNSDTFNVAKLIIQATESGLDWRIDAAKDIADWDNNEAGTVDISKNLKFINKFWRYFNNGVREYNPKTYTIGELTDLNNDVFPKKHFLNESGFTTLSDYDWFYGATPKVYGQSPEGYSNNNIQEEFSTQFNNYKDSGMLEHINFAHRFVGNQDKPRITHMLSMDVSKFKEDKAKEIKRVFESALDSTGGEFVKYYKKALEQIADGHYLYNGEWREYDSENFGVRPYNFVIEDLRKQALATDSDFKKLANEKKSDLAKFEANLEKNLISGAMGKNRAITFAQVCMPGNPTTYAGDELGMTGWETPCKNEKQENRNRLRWELLDDPNYEFVKTNFEKLAQIRNIRNNEAASPLVNGTTIKLNNQELDYKDDKGDILKNNVIAFYRYNDKTDAIVVMHNVGDISGPKKVNMHKIELDGLPNGLPADTIYLDATDSKKRYKVEGGLCLIRVDENNKPKGKVELGEAGLVLVREKDFNGKEFHDYKITDPRVTLTNTKYNIAQTV